METLIRLAVKILAILLPIVVVVLTISFVLGALGAAAGISVAGAKSGNSDVAWFCTKAAIVIVVVVIAGACWLLKK